MIRFPFLTFLKYFDKRVLRNIIILIILNIAVVAFLFLAVKHHKRLRIRLHDLENDIIRSNRKIDEYPALITEKLAVEKFVNYYTDQLIEEREKTRLLGEISDLAKKSEVSIISMSPQIFTRKLPKGFATYFKPLSYELKLDCGYHEFGAFLNGIEHFNCVLIVEQINIEPGEENNRIHSIKILLTTYAKI
ncbi:MAG: type 4a pilus biogenesis protein PilO [Candidatus Omnitrophica bacterium]|nr:type 4a pilus biogenesis protein PilO [Candidatus Omnitrophota bacterium]